MPRRIKRIGFTNGEMKKYKYGSVREVVISSVVF